MTLEKNQNKLRGTGISFEETLETNAYAILHVVEDGIERITYTPKVRKHETPILMLHGMWHGAWCWEPWQKFIASQGWETISFSLPAGDRTTLVVYDVAGNRIRTLVNQDLEAGDHQVIWNGSDEGGRQVAAGIYLYRLDSGSVHEVKRMTLVR